MTLRFGVIPTNGRDCVDKAVNALLPQVNYLLIIEAGLSITHRTYPESVHTLTDDVGGINISRWWNLGLDWCQAVAAAFDETTWDVAIINDDVVVPATWLCYIADDMRALGCVAACSGGTGSPLIHRKPGPIAAMQRLQGFAFVLAGESGIRADETYRWYFSDDKLGCIAASMGGVVMYPNCHVKHHHPNNQVSHEMQVMITEDAQKFKREWGSLPR